MAKKTKQLIREAGPNINRKELNKIAKSAGSLSKALDKIASVQKSRTKAGKNAPSIGSAAANMLIKQAQSSPVGVYQLGTSKIAQAIRSMTGTPAGQRNPQSGGPMLEAKPGIGLGYVPSGMVLKPSGKMAVRPQQKAATIAAPPAAAAAAGISQASPTASTGYDDGIDASYFDQLLASIMADYQNNTAEMADMFNQQFDQLSSEFDMMNPLQLAQLGKAYGGDTILARRQRQRKSRSDYMRGGMLGMMTQPIQQLANMAIGGGVTL